MPRCDCVGGQCSCVVIGGSGATVTGAGTTTNPYIIDADPQLPSSLLVVDTDTVDMHAVGNGTADDPLVVSADASLAMDDLTNVEAASPAAGDTLQWNGTEWVTGSPPVVPPGAVNVGPGLVGTGAVEEPLAAAVSGVWGVGELDGYGDNSLVGLAIYVDSNGQLRAEPRDTSYVTWDDIEGKPSAFPTTWDDVTGKPTSWGVTEASAGVVSAASGWRLEWQYGHRTGQVATVNFRVVRTGGTISGTAGGNIANTRIGTLSAVYQPYWYGQMGTTSTGVLTSAWVNSDGAMYLSATVPNNNINRGDVFTLGGTWVCKG